MRQQSVQTGLMPPRGCRAFEALILAVASHPLLGLHMQRRWAARAPAKSAPMGSTARTYVSAVMLTLGTKPRRTHANASTCAHMRLIT